MVVFPAPVGPTIAIFSPGEISKLIFFRTSIPGTVMDNIRIGRPNATDEEVVEVCKKLGIHDFIMRMPNGYQTDAGEAGRLLSTGEKQLISFARAMLRDPPILILDEAISAVDPMTEEMIKKAVKKLLENRTAIIIAHRLTLARDWDRIIMLEDRGRWMPKSFHH